MLISDTHIYPSMQQDWRTAHHHHRRRTWLCWTKMHYLDFDQLGNLIVYARYRLVERSNEVKIERVVLDKSVRGKGQGKRLMKIILNDINLHFPRTSIVLSAQLDVCSFYRSLGFVTQGEAYDDGGIEHISMFYQQ